MNKLFLLSLLSLIMFSCGEDPIEPEVATFFPNQFVYDRTEFTPTKVEYKVKENGFEKVNTVEKESTTYNFDKPAFEEFVPEVINFSFKFIDESNYALFKAKNGEIITTDSIVSIYTVKDDAIEVYDIENKPFFWFDYNEDKTEIWSTSIVIFYDSDDLTIVNSGSIGKKSIEDYLDQKNSLKKLNTGDTFYVLIFDSYFKKE